MRPKPIIVALPISHFSCRFLHEIFSSLYHFKNISKAVVPALGSSLLRNLHCRSQFFLEINVELISSPLFAWGLVFLCPAVFCKVTTNEVNVDGSDTSGSFIELRYADFCHFKRQSNVGRRPSLIDYAIVIMEEDFRLFAVFSLDGNL